MNDGNNAYDYICLYEKCESVLNKIKKRKSSDSVKQLTAAEIEEEEERPKEGQK